MVSAKEVEEAAAAWFAKRDNGEWRETDQAAFESWLANDIAHRIAFIRIRAAWTHAERLKALGAGVAAGTVPDVGQWHFSPLFERPANVDGVPAQREARHVPRWAIACVVAFLMVATGVLGWHIAFNLPPEYRTPLGGLATVPLADGSTVTLNTDSEIRVALTDRARIVKMPRGEAFFEVAKDSHRPFVVEAGMRRVIAVGTKFSVRRDGDLVRVVVTEGSVRLEAEGSPHAPPILLKPGDIARAGHDGVFIQQKPVAVLEQENLAWRNGYVVFHETPLAEALGEFNRYNPEKTVVTDPELATMKIGGSFRVSNIDAFRQLLETALPIKAVRNGDEIVLERD